MTEDYTLDTSLEMMQKTIESCGGLFPKESVFPLMEILLKMAKEIEDLRSYSMVQENLISELESRLHVCVTFPPSRLEQGRHDPSLYS